MFRYATLLLLLGGLAGCSQLKTFRVVDSQTGQPVDGVTAERLSGSIRPSPAPLILMNMLSPVERQETKEDGKVAFEKGAEKFAVNPRSNNPAYARAYVKATPSGAKVSYPDLQREVEVKAVNGVVEVPLPRRASTAALDIPAPK